MKNLYRLTSLLLVAFTVFSCFGQYALADEEYKIVENGLISLYDAQNNTGDGFDKNATVWKDLAGENDITVEKSAQNYFTETAYHLNSKRFYFADELFSLINSEEFTFEMKIGAIEKTGSSYTTMVNSSGNDNFALFLRTGGDYIEFKSSSNARPKVPDGKNLVENSTLSLTFSMKSKLCIMYIDGIEIASVSITQKIGAQGKLFFGHEEASKQHIVDYEGFRFYNRALSASEVATNAKADGNYDFSYKPALEFNRVEQAPTNIAGGIAFSEILDSDAAIQGFAGRENKPAISIFHVDGTLGITDGKGKKIADLSVNDGQMILSNGSIPAFYVHDEESVTALCDYLKELGYEDFFVISDNGALVTKARESYPVLRGVVDMTALYSEKTDLSDEDVLNIRKNVNKNLSKIVILPQSVANKEDVNRLANYGITVWIRANDDLQSKKDALYLLLSGAHGILSKNTDLLVDVASTTLVSGTVTRMPLNIGHRGTSPSVAQAPENTVENALISYANGANAIEVDIFLSADGHIIINHNSTTTNMKLSTTGKPTSLSIESARLAQLKKLYYAGYYEKDENGNDKLDDQGNKIEYTGFKISTLEELFKAFQGKDVTLIIEFKSSNKKLVPAFKKLVEDYDMYDQCSVISYESYKQHEQMVKYFPEMTVGLLWGTITPSANKVDQSIRQGVLDAQKHNTTLNPGHGGFSSSYVRAATYRGVTVWPYTINNTVDIRSNFLYGHAAITTDYSGVIGEFAKTLTLTYAPAVLPGSKFTVEATVTNYKREDVDASSVQLTVLEGKDLIKSIDGLSISLKDGAEGEIVLLASYRQKFAVNTGYTIYTQPQTIRVSADAPVSPSEPQTETPVPSDDVPTAEQSKEENSESLGNEDENSDGYMSILAGVVVAFVESIMLIGIVAAVVIVAAVIVVIVVIVKKKNKK